MIHKSGSVKKNTNQIQAGTASAKRGARILRAPRSVSDTRWTKLGPTYPPAAALALL